MGIPGRGRIPP